MFKVSFLYISFCAFNIQGDSEGKASVMGGDSMRHCEKNVDMNTCLILNA